MARNREVMVLLRLYTTAKYHLAAFCFLLSAFIRPNRDFALALYEQGE